MPNHHFRSTDSSARLRSIEGSLEIIKDFCQLEMEEHSDSELRNLFETVIGGIEHMLEEFDNYQAKGSVPWERFEASLPQKSADPWD